MKTYEIIMLGNTSVGKTSMLSALSKEIKDINNVSGVQFVPYGDSITMMDDAWFELEETIRQGGLYQPIKGVIEGNTDYVTYHFDLCFKGETRAKVDFIDTKGSFIRDIDGSGLQEQTSSALGAFCVIDAAVLMECDPRTNNRFNRPGLIEDLLGKVFARESHPKFVAFVLVKCETYMQTEEDIQWLRNKFHEVYAESIALLQKKRINSYAMAVQTLGCVRFKSLVAVPCGDAGELQLPQFVKVPNSTKVEPHDCEVPLILTMKNVMWAMKDEGGFFDWLLNILGMGSGLNEYLGQLEGIKLDKKAKSYYEQLSSDC